MDDLSGRVAIVTGAGRGIGRSIALRFAAAGARVAALARTESEIRDTAGHADPPGSVLAVVADVSSPEQVAGAVDTTRRELGPVDILVNNAAVFLHKPILDTSPREWEDVLRINLTGPFLFARAVLPEMLERDQGKIINICSTASHRSYPSQAAYVASKHALLGFSKTLAQETHGTGVSVHALSPGGVNTSFVRTRDDVDFSQYMHPDEIAASALFIAAMRGAAVVDELIIRRKGAEPFR